MLLYEAGREPSRSFTQLLRIAYSDSTSVGDEAIVSSLSCLFLGVSTSCIFGRGLKGARPAIGDMPVDAALFRPGGGFCSFPREYWSLFFLVCRLGGDGGRCDLGNGESEPFARKGRIMSGLVRVGDGGTTDGEAA